MFIIVIKIELHIPASNSLKHKRMILSSLKGRLKSNFNISVTEVGGQDKWQRASLAISSVISQRKQAEPVISEVLNYIETFNAVEVLTHETEIL